MRLTDIPTTVKVKNLIGETLNIGGFCTIKPFATQDIRLSLLADHRQEAAYRALLGGARSKVLKIVSPGIAVESVPKVVLPDPTKNPSSRAPQGAPRPSITPESAVQLDQKAGAQEANTPKPSKEKAAKGAKAAKAVVKEEPTAEVAPVVEDQEIPVEADLVATVAVEPSYEELVPAVQPEDTPSENTPSEETISEDIPPAGDPLLYDTEQILAAAEELQKLKGVGEVTATRLIELGILDLPQFIIACDNGEIPSDIISSSALPGLRLQAMQIARPLHSEGSPSSPTSSQSAEATLPRSSLGF